MLHYVITALLALSSNKQFYLDCLLLISFTRTTDSPICSNAWHINLSSMYSSSWNKKFIYTNLASVAAICCWGPNLESSKIVASYTGFVQKFDWFSIIFQDKITLFSKLFKVFYTSLYKNTLKLAKMAKMNLMLNIKHKFHILQTVLAV